MTFEEHMRAISAAKDAFNEAVGHAYQDGYQVATRLSSISSIYGFDLSRTVDGSHAPPPSDDDDEPVPGSYLHTLADVARGYMK